MANTKISQLPSWTGTAADQRWFVMNNSGETETFKFSGYTSPFREVTSGNYSVKSNYIVGTTPGVYDMLLGGTGNTITSTKGRNTILNGVSNTISADRDDGLNTIVGSYQSTIGPSYCGLASGMFSTYQSTMNNTGYGSVIIGGYGNSLDDLNAWGSAVVGGYLNNKQGGGGFGFIGAGTSNIVSGSNGAVVGGANNNAGYRCFVGAGESNTITGSNGVNGILAGSTNNINNSSYSVNIGGTNNSITGNTHVVMLGCSGRTATKSQTTFVENLVLFNYSNLNFVDDTAAAAGGVVLGQVYHNAGALRVRIV